MSFFNFFIYPNCCYFPSFIELYFPLLDWTERLKYIDLYASFYSSLSYHLFVQADLERIRPSDKWLETIRREEKKIFFDSTSYPSLTIKIDTTISTAALKGILLPRAKFNNISIQNLCNVFSSFYCLFYRLQRIEFMFKKLWTLLVLPELVLTYFPRRVLLLMITIVLKVE